MRKRAALCFFLVSLALALSSCGPRTLSSQGYQELVVSTLRGGELEKDLPPFPGLIPSVKAFFDALYCAESNCTIPYEMSYAATIAERKMVDIYMYRGKLCNNKKVRPPQELEPVHEQICKILDRIRAKMDGIKITATMAAQVFAQSMSDPPALERVAQSYSAKIMERKEEIVEALRELRAIDWLAPVFEGFKAEIPELLREAE